jgi:SAM-dependent methyltransferase
VTEPRPPSADAYRDIGTWYDAEHDGFDEDIALYLQLAQVVGDPILELGCGTGRVMEPLCAAGWRVTGVDSSPAMLDRARRRLAGYDRTGTATLIAADMADALATPHGAFGLAIVALNGLLHLSDPAEQRAALAHARSALDPRGMLVVDVFNPDVGLARIDDRVVIHEGTWPLEGSGEVTKLSSRRFDRATQTIETALWYDEVDAAGAVRRTATAFAQRYVSRAELLLMLELAGFTEPQVYGSYDLDPFESGSERILVTAEVTPAP